MTGEGHRPETPITVVSALIFRGPDREEILLGVRRGTPIATRHPGVLSTPTIRLPVPLFTLLTSSYGPPPEQPGLRAVDGPEVLVGHAGHTRTVDSFVLDELLCRKVGLAGALVEDRFSATARARLIGLDEVADPLGTGRAEWTLMLSYEMYVSRGADELPSATESYSRLLWAPARRLPAALSNRDALHVDDSLDPFEVCIDGLCIRIAAALIG